MSSNQNPVVAVDHVQKSFGEAKVLRDISLAVNPGEVVAIIGRPVVESQRCCAA